MNFNDFMSLLKGGPSATGTAGGFGSIGSGEAPAAGGFLADAMNQKGITGNLGIASEGGGPAGTSFMDNLMGGDGPVPDMPENKVDGSSPNAESQLKSLMSNRGSRAQPTGPQRQLPPTMLHPQMISLFGGK